MDLIAFLLTDPIKVEIAAAKDPASLLGSLSAFVWPIVTLALLVMYYGPLSSFLAKIAARATEIGIGSWATIKLPEVKEAAASSATIRELQSDPWMESSNQWFAKFASSLTVSEYALLDVGDGKQWITSRLYIFAVMLQRMKALKCIVFVQTTAPGAGPGAAPRAAKFLGCITPEDVRWSLAAHQGWLESAYAKVYGDAVGLMPQAATRIDGSLDVTTAENIVRNFIFAVRQPVLLPPIEQWIHIEKINTYEHATWLNEAEVLRLFGTYLRRDAVERRADDSEKERQAEIKRVVRKSAPFVALVQNGAYRSLVNRIQLLAEIGESVT